MRIECFFTYYAIRTTFYESLWRKTNDTNHKSNSSYLHPEIVELGGILSVVSLLPRRDDLAIDGNFGEEAVTKVIITDALSPLLEDAVGFI